MPALRQTQGLFLLQGQTIEELREELQAALFHVANRLDTLSGDRGTPVFQSNLNINGHAVENLAEPPPNENPATSLSAVPRKFAVPLVRQRNGQLAWDCRFIPMINDAYAETANGVPTLQQVLDLIQDAQGIFGNEPFLTAAASAMLTAERQVTPEAGVLTTTDNGPNSTFVVGVATNGITDAKLRQGTALSTMGRSVNSLGNVADIVATAASDAVLRESGNVLGFGTVATAGIANNAVTDAKLRQGAAISLIGRSVNSAGDVADIAAAAASDAVLRESGNVLGFGTVATAGIANNAVTDTKLRDAAAVSVIGRSVNSAGDPADIAAAANGNVLRRSANVVGFGQVDLADGTNAVANALTVANGGTGVVTLASNGVLYGNGAGVVQVTAQGAANTVLTANAGVPSFSATPTITSLTTTAAANVGGDINHDGANIGFNAAAPVAQSTGWSVSNVTADKVYDADLTSLDEIADVLGTLINYLKLRGDLGA